MGIAIWCVAVRRSKPINPSKVLKTPASGVLTSLRDSTYRSRVRLLASSLAAALLNGHFEHPVWLYRCPSDNLLGIELAETGMFPLLLA